MRGRMGHFSSHCAMYVSMVFPSSSGMSIIVGASWLYGMYMSICLNSLFGECMMFGIAGIW